MDVETSWNTHIEKWGGKDKISISKNDMGSTLIPAMIILLLLTIIGISSIDTSIVEQKITRNYSLNEIAFFAADAGIEYGRATLNDLKQTDSGSWDNFLANNTLNTILDAKGGRKVGDATFILSIQDNDDLDSSPLIDTDNIIILTSTVNYNGALAIIETYIHYLGTDAYAQEHYDSKSSGQTGDERSAPSNNVRW